MGDRSNLYFPSDYGAERHQHGVYLYAHWGGTELFTDAQQALGTDAARSRWDDGAYLTRIVVQRILERHVTPDDALSWGLSAQRTDNEYPILVIDAGTQRAYFMAEGNEGNDPGPGPGWTFDEFVALPEIPLPKEVR